MYFLKNARSALKNVHTQLPTGSSYQKLVKISYLALTSTATVLSGCNPHTGTIGTAGAASPAVFDFPSDEPLSSKGGRKRRKPDDTVASTSQELPEGEEEEEQDDLEFEAPEDDDSPVVILLHEAELEKGQSSVFVAKEGLQPQMNLSSTNRIHTLAKAKVEKAKIWL